MGKGLTKILFVSIFGGVEIMDVVIYSSFENRFSPFEKSFINHTGKCIDGRITGSNKCIGYCQYEGHPGFLTKELRKEHNCVKKGCYHYIQKPKKAV